MKIYEVGGTLRDEFLNLKNTDKDYAVEADSYASMRTYILACGGKIWQEREEFGTIRAKMPKIGDADFTICRIDGFYSDNRRPDDIKVGTILDDLARRDFTMNAIARDIDTGEILDPFNGRRDIESKIIRCVGNTEERMYEDALRIFRAIRFSVTKNMGIDYKLKKFIWDIPDFGFLLRGISQERIYEEMTKMYTYNTHYTWYYMDLFPKVFGWVFDSTDIRLKPTLESK